MKFYLQICLVFIVGIESIHSLKCYICSATEFDQRCVTDVESVGVVTNCNKDYCVSIRQEFIEPKGKVSSMFRGCQDDPDHKNEVIEDNTYRYYYRACQEDLCNDGEGKDTSASNMVKNDGFGALLVPDRAGATTVRLNFASVIPALYILTKVK